MTIKEYIESVRTHLAKEYGEVKPEWEITLMALTNTLTRYIQVKKKIDDDGIFDDAAGKKNPLLSTEKDLLATVLKLSQKLGISPWDASKIKNSPEDDTEDFIENLTGGNDE